MKKLTGFLIVALALTTGRAYCTPIATTAGSNLTAYNPGSGAINNNTWNNMMNGRSGGGTGAVADFGNCNSLILRCASPKCANGGCVDVSIARPIVAGCVAANSACKQYGDDLIDTLAAQLVANSIAKSNDAANAAAESAAAAAAQQSAQQIQQMQMQMQQMQSQMAAQNAETVAQLQAALDEQKQMAAAREAEAAAASAKLAQQNASGLTSAQEAAAANGVSSDVLVRNQISGQIMTEIENAEKQLNEMKAVMERAFQYAGCDASGNNCTGPARVKRFKEIASEFFAPYENTLDAVYDALILAQTVGVDISDIYMMLNDSCNSWGQYLCGDGQAVYYTGTNCKGGISVSGEGSAIIGGKPCNPGDIIPMSDGGCQLVKILTDRDEAKRNWDWSASNTKGNRVEIGCASAALDNSTLFAGRRKQSNIDIEVLQRILQQDAPTISSGSSLRNRSVDDVVQYCATGEDGFNQLQKIVATRKLVLSGKHDDICIDEKEMKRVFEDEQGSALNSGDESSTSERVDACKKQSGEDTVSNDVTHNATLACLCSKAYGGQWNNTTKQCTCTDVTYTLYDETKYDCINPSTKKTKTETENPGMAVQTDIQGICDSFGGVYDKDKNTCNCASISDANKKNACVVQIQNRTQFDKGHAELMKETSDALKGLLDLKI